MIDNDDLKPAVDGYKGIDQNRNPERTVEDAGRPSGGVGYNSMFTSPAGHR